MENSLEKELREFMVWFKENQPELYEKYQQNIDIPMKEGGGVTVTPGWGIMPEEQQMLLKVVKGYYERS